jgi:hypothetical protein
MRAHTHVGRCLSGTRSTGQGSREKPGYATSSAASG